MSTYRLSTPPSSAGGFALITAMIFLVLLTLVALVALRGSGLEAIVSGNNAQRTEAFESSEAARITIGDVIDAHVYNRGWPTSVTVGTATGEVLPSEFGSLPTGLTLTSLGKWYGDNAEDDTTTSPLPYPAGFTPDNLAPDASYSISVGTTAAPAVVYANLSVYKLRVDLASGAGSAMSQGYEGLGRAAAGGGGTLYFYVKSSGRDLKGSTSTSNYDTSADFRYVIRN